MQNNFDKKLTKFAAALLMAAQANAQSIYAGDLCCTFYKGQNYSGDGISLCYDYEKHGQYGQQTFQMLDYEDYHDNVESFWCGAHVEYDLCNDIEGDCGGHLGQSGAGNIKTPQMGHLNHLDRIYMRYYDPADRGAVTAFTNLDCTNWGGALHAPVDPKLTAFYNLDDIQWRHLINDQISSVTIPYGYSMVLYDHDGFIESSKLVLDGEPWYDGIQTQRCINLNDYGWDDRVSSVAVYRTNRGAFAQGRWQAFTSTESIDFTYRIGMESADSTATKASMSYSMTQDMHAGIEFWGASVSAGMSQTASTALEIDTQHDMASNVEIEYGITCTGDVGASGGVGLWQFVVANGDGSVWTQTRHTVCRYGEHYNQAPDCPWSACANGDCTECNDDWEA